MNLNTGDVFAINNHKYVVVAIHPVANNQNNYALVAEKFFMHPKLFDNDFEQYLAFYMTDAELARNNAEPPTHNMLVQH